MACPIISTALGQAKGFALDKAKCDEAKQVFAFLGLPFAKPPVGSLRFEPPQKPDPWKGTLDATKPPPIPMQNSYLMEQLLPYVPFPMIFDENPDNMSEDCLYLNVYTSNPNKEAKMPVLFWIYGGGFTVGGAGVYNGQALCGLHDVVLVVPQYRVNVFGFFTTGKDTKWPGNMGLLDQVMALEWTRDNIASFGGDPKNVTIFGQSSGSISVSMHVTSPMSRGLFQRAISHSGAGTVATMMIPDQSNLRSVILKDLGIHSMDPEKIMDELKALDAKKILECLEKDNINRMMVATIDGKFVPKHTAQLLQEGNFNPVQYIIGVCSSELAGILSYSQPANFNTGLDKETARNIVHGMFSQMLPPEKADVVFDFYCKGISEDKYKWSKLVSCVLGDSLFVNPSVQHALAHSGSGHDTYFYYMTQQTRMHHDDAYSGEVKHKPEFCEADHCDDVFYTFGFPFINGKFTLDTKWSEEEKEMSKKWMNTICQFAKTGNPNCDGEIKWPKYDANNKQHLILKWPYEVGSNLLDSKVKFWSETFPSLLM